MPKTEHELEREETANRIRRHYKHPGHGLLLQLDGMVESAERDVAEYGQRAEDQAALRALLAAREAVVDHLVSEHRRERFCLICGSRRVTR